MKRKYNLEYSDDMAVVMKKKVGNHKMFLKAIWKYAKENDLGKKGAPPPGGPAINADKLLKKLFGKDEIQPLKDLVILKKAGHVKPVKSDA